MKTVKTTLIVVATLVALYLVYDFVTGTASSYHAETAKSDAISDRLDQRAAWEALASQYRGKTVTIRSTNAQGVPLYQIYKYNKVGTLRHGDKVTLLDVDLYHSDGDNVKVRQEDGFEGHVDISSIRELNE